MTFEDSLRSGGDLVAAWDEMDVSRRRLAVFTVGAQGAALLTETMVDPPMHQEITNRLLDRGLRIGHTYGDHEFVWAFDGRGETVWSAEGVVWEGPAPGKVVRVTTFLDPRDRGHRGVRLAVAGGAEVTVVEEHDETATLDPFYNADNLFLDSLWAHYLGHALSQWLSVPHQNQISGRREDHA